MRTKAKCHRAPVRWTPTGPPRPHPRMDAMTSTATQRHRWRQPLLPPTLTVPPPAAAHPGPRAQRCYCPPPTPAMPATASSHASRDTPTKLPAAATAPLPSPTLGLPLGPIKCTTVHTTRLSTVHREEQRQNLREGGHGSRYGPYYTARAHCSGMH